MLVPPRPRGQRDRPGPDRTGPTADELVRAARAARTVADLGDLLRRLRRRHARAQGDSELTYRELAGRTGWSRAAVGEYFGGRTLPPTDRFDALTALLGASGTERGALATARDRVEEHRRAPHGPVPAAAPHLPRQLPRDVPGFAGRAAELASLDAVLAAAARTSAAAVSAVSGMPGLGKTALAVHWAHRVADQFPDGQLYANLRGFDRTGRPVAAAEALRGFLAALGLPAPLLPATLDARAALYRSWLAGKRVLVVLDNARDAEHARPLLPGTPTAAVVVTSRNPLTGLVAADGAHPLALDLLSRAEARELLAHRVGDRRVAAERRAVEQIVAACGRLPLALRIAAARANTRLACPLAAVAAELGAGPTPLDALATGDPATDLRTVFSWSYAALGPAAARLFRLLAAGPGPGPDTTAAAAAGRVGLRPAEARPLLAELAGAGLLAEPAPGRYALSPLLRAYAADLGGAIAG